MELSDGLTETLMNCRWIDIKPNVININITLLIDGLTESPD